MRGSGGDTPGNIKVRGVWGAEPPSITFLKESYKEHGVLVARGPWYLVYRGWGGKPPCHPLGPLRGLGKKMLVLLAPQGSSGGPGGCNPPVTTSVPPQARLIMRGVT